MLPRFVLQFFLEKMKKSFWHKIDKKKSLRFALVAWVVFSVLFVATTIFKDFRATVFQGGFDLGFTQAVETVIEKANNLDCNYFPVFSGERKVELLNIECLKKTQANLNAENLTGRE